MTRRILPALLTIYAAACWAQPQFRTGQAARALVGQPTFTAQLPDISATFPAQRLLGSSGGLAVVNDTLFVADSSRVSVQPDNRRVMIFNNISRDIRSFSDEIGANSGRCPVCVGEADIVLGQKDFKQPAADQLVNPLPTAQNMRGPNAVHSDGRTLVVADTDYNRLLIWRNLPTASGQAADVVLGQDNFTTLRRLVTDNKSFRGPQGVWVQNGKLFVADTQNHRVLIWNTIPTTSNQAADIVLGQPDFNTAPEVDLTKAVVNTKADSMLNPVSVTSDGVRLFVADLGHNRVLIWNSIPTRNAQPADVVFGQPDFASGVANNTPKLCASNGTDSAGAATYPARCAKTLDFPRFALSDGKRLFISDGGNDRILVLNSIPTTNGAAADAILGQLSETLNLTTDNPNGIDAFPNRSTAADVVRTPGALAWDGANLFVADPYNRRVLVYTPAEQSVPPTGVRNAASIEIFAVGSVTFGGTLKENDEVTLKLNGQDYKFKITKKIADDKDFFSVVRAFVDLINAGKGDPSILATPNYNFLTLILTARLAGEDGNAFTLGTALSDAATVVATASGATLQGGQDAAAIAPGTIVTILGENLADETASANIAFPPPAGVKESLPLELGGVQVYFDGIRAPLLSVSPGSIKAQMPWEVVDTTSVTGWVRTKRKDGRVSVSTAVSVPVIQQNPGIFTEDGTDPRPGIVTHTSSFGIGTVSVDGTATENDTASILINDRRYTYKVVKADTLVNVRNGLIDAINKDGGDPEIVAFAAGAFTRIRLRSRVAGPAGNGIPIRVDTSTGAQVIMTAFNSQTCCANREGARVTEENPAIPGETITVFATGLGLVKPTDAEGRNQKINTITGLAYDDTPDNVPVEFVSSLAGGRTANVIFARLVPGTIGIYEVQLELNSDLPSNPLTQLTIAQSFQVSNIITFPIVKPEN